MPEKAATARRGRAGLGDMDDVFAGKDEPVAALAEPAPRPARGAVGETACQARMSIGGMNSATTAP